MGVLFATERTRGDMANEKKSRKGVGGRPTKYDPAMCETVIEVMKDGGSIAKVAATLDVDLSTVHLWRQVHPEFSNAIKKGLTLAQVWWEEVGKDALHADKFQPAVYQMQMRNRFDWDKKTTLEVTGEGGGPLTFRWEKPSDE